MLKCCFYSKLGSEVKKIAELNNDWWDAFGGSFQDEEDVIEFIFERFDTKDFEDSYRDMGGYGEPNECFKITAEDKKQCVYDFMMDLIKRANK